MLPNGHLSRIVSKERVNQQNPTECLNLMAWNTAIHCLLGTAEDHEDDFL
jgi:hypothetical protein